MIHAKELYSLTGHVLRPVPEHEGGRNRVYVCSAPGGKRTVLRVSSLNDRSENEYLAEAEFVRYLAQNGAPVADVIPSVNGRLVERIGSNGRDVFLCLFAYAEGMLISDNGYRYRDGAPLEEYFVNTGKTLGVLHRLSKAYVPEHRRPHYREAYSRDRIDKLIPDSFAPLKHAIFQRLEQFSLLPDGPDDYGLVHFDFSDGNYHVDMKTGQITVFDFDNCINCWYMFDLANLWLHGTGWCRHKDAAGRRKSMDAYFQAVLNGYRSETALSESMLDRLPLFIDMVLIENVVDEFECCSRENALPEYADVAEAGDFLIRGIPFAGFC